MTMPLFLLHMRPDVRLLSAWVGRHHARHARQSVDLGDALHGLLRAAFGDGMAPQPFRYFDESRGLLAYTRMDASSLTEQLVHGDPLALRTLGLDTDARQRGWRLRAFPTHWQAGYVLGFEVRVRPTVRGARGEQDVFLNAAWQAPEQSLQREVVYVRWLRERLTGGAGEERQPWHGAAELLGAHLTAWKRSKIVRREQAKTDGRRHSRAIDGPDAVLQGRLRVLDSAAFAHLLVRGVGRHRAFGFGMLLLRPSS